MEELSEVMFIAYYLIDIIIRQSRGQFASNLNFEKDVCLASPQKNAKLEPTIPGLVNSKPSLQTCEVN